MRVKEKDLTIGPPSRSPTRLEPKSESDPRADVGSLSNWKTSSRPAECCVHATLHGTQHGGCDLSCIGLGSIVDNMNIRETYEIIFIYEIVGHVLVFHPTSSLVALCSMRNRDDISKEESGNGRAKDHVSY